MGIIFTVEGFGIVQRILGRKATGKNSVVSTGSGPYRSSTGHLPNPRCCDPSHNGCRENGVYLMNDEWFCQWCADDVFGCLP